MITMGKKNKFRRRYNSSSSSSSSSSDDGIHNPYKKHLKRQKKLIKKAHKRCKKRGLPVEVVAAELGLTIQQTPTGPTFLLPGAPQAPPNYPIGVQPPPRVRPGGHLPPYNCPPQPYGMNPSGGHPPPPPASVPHMYPGQQPSYPNQQPSYPTQQPSYPTQHSSYPTQQPSYSVQQPSYPIQRPSYPTQPGANFPSTPPVMPGNAPQYPPGGGGGGAGNYPYYSASAPYTGAAPGKTSDMPPYPK